MIAPQLPTPAGIRGARERLRPHLPETPLVRSELLSQRLGADIWLKNETVSPIASFKARGALNALLSQPAGWTGAVTSSTGNHGQGVAWAARRLDRLAHVFLPDPPNPAKRRMIESLGATVHIGGADIDEAKGLALDFAAARSLVFVDDGEDLAVMEGAGTVGLEVGERLDQVDAAFVPMGSGSLAAGFAAALKGAGTSPGVKVVAALSEGSPAMGLSWRARAPVSRPVATLADGLGCRVPARLALDAILATVDGVELVPDAELLAAVRRLAVDGHLLAEPSAAAGLAAALRVPPPAGSRVVIVVTGANVTLAQLEAVFSH
ncbi:MAG: pyridoxal-phosphate dependent enzyme [Candidatus Dormibacteraeota bacterium]|nr:pyridoxal-phosphate dependent enzyme [Candidatus Dormibacteraeota bacterium]